MSSSFSPKICICGPGGVRGFLQLGALLAIQSTDFLNDVGTFVGVSVGALISLCLVANIPLREIIYDGLDIDLFEDLSSVTFESIIQGTGLISRQSISTCLEERIRESIGYIPTLQALHLATGKKFVAVTYNITEEKTVFLSPETHPTLSCIEAVSMSMNIPLLFYKIQYQNCTYIDGAFGNPLPVNRYDDGKTDIFVLDTPSHQNNKSPLSLNKPLIHTANLIEKIQNHTNENQESLLDYLFSIALSPVSALREILFSKITDKTKILTISMGKEKSTLLIATSDEKIEMIITGFHKACNFLSAQFNITVDKQILEDFLDEITESSYDEESKEESFNSSKVL